MATSGTAYGNGVTIGSSVNNNYMFVNWQLASQNAAAGISYINWQAYFHYTSSDAQLDDGDVSINGSLRWDVPGRVKNYAGTFTTRDHYLAGENSFAIAHNTDGSKTFNISGSIGGSLSARSSLSTNFDLPGFDKTPTTPAINGGTRNSNGTSFSTTNWSGSVNNSGPGVTWYLQSSTNNSTFTDTGSSTTSSGGNLSHSGLTPNTTYYYRIRATNSVSTKYSGSITVYGVPSAPTSFSATVSTTDSRRISCSWIAPTNTQGGITGYDFYVGGTKVNPSNITGTSYIVNTKSLTTTDYLVPGTSYELYVVAKNAIGFNNSTSYSRSSSLTRRAPGAPAAPTLPATYTTGGITYTNPINFGRDVTITCNVSPDDYGIPINTANAEQGYFVQYRYADEAEGTYSSWSTPVKMSDQTNRVHTYPLLDAAKWYKFRIYAANTIVNNPAGTKTYYPHNSGSTANFSVETTALFVPAAGKRFDGEDFVITNTAKRYNAATNSWVNIATAKRYNEVQGVWENLT